MTVQELIDKLKEIKRPKADVFIKLRKNYVIKDFYTYMGDLYIEIERDK